MKIAVSGKGGVGKTTISAYLSKKFAQEGYHVYAVDADPDVSLGTVLGLENSQVTNLKPIVDMREVIASKSGGDGAYYSLNPNVDDVLDQYSIDIDKIKFLKMGAVKQGGSSCYCRENSFLNSLMNSLLLNKEDVVVLDMGAGIEHLTRGTSKGVDVILVVTEPTKVSVQTANVVSRLASELGIEQVKFVGNKIRNKEELEFLQTNLEGGELIGHIAFNHEVMDLAMGKKEQNISVLQSEIENIYQELKKLN